MELAREVSEAELTKSVIAIAQRRGVLVAHFRTAQTARGRHVTAVAGDGAGYPDLTLVGLGGAEWWELKTQAGRPSPRQVAWQRRLHEAGLVHRYVRPEDLLSGMVDRWLSELAKPGLAEQLLQGRLDEALDLLAEERRQHERDLEVDGV